MKPQEIKDLIEKRAREIAEEVYAQKATQYGVATVPIHTHNDIDSPRLEGASVKTFITIPAGSDGVLSVNNLEQQSYTYLGQLNPQTPVLNAPLAVIQGFGVGGQSTFHGGDAPDGTVIMFTNGVTLSTLNIRSDGQWYQIQVDAIQ